jgi:simple sugar transport system substrate-binding protein
MKALRIKASVTALALAASVGLITVGSTTSSSAAATVRWCSGVKIAAFPGGPQGGTFAVNVYNGQVQAAKDLGASVKYYWSNWDPSVMTSQLKEALASKPDGIAGIIGMVGDASADPIIAQAFKQGTIVANANSQLPIADVKYASQGEGFVGAVNHKAGVDLANEAIARGHLKKGGTAFVWGLKGAAGDRAQRTIGIIDGLKAAGIKVVYQEIDQATNTTPASGAPTFVGIMAAHPDIKSVFLDHGGLTATAETYLKAASIKPGAIYVAGFDMSPATATAIKSGYLSLVIDQQEWLQGYLPILQVCLTKKYGFSGLYINTSGGFVDKSNVAFIAPLAAKLIR